MRRACLIPVLLLALTASAQDGTFQILKGGKPVGRIDVKRTEAGGKAVYRMTSSSSIVVLWTHDVRSDMLTEYQGGQLTRCYSTYHVDDELRDSSYLYTVGGRPLCYVHPGEVFVGRTDNPWTVARMYYEEPVGQDSIFVESELRDCPLRAVGDGRYILSMPNKGTNHYTYRDGVLHEVLVDRTLFNLLFRRT
ncbi:MAG TPA: hypothetical protein PKE21_07010 [Flavobacteriales bacterium]|nr:hypothetical protein [Flavobacteriales bacterium]HMR27210.1 hypothetical protein [Flavobacteriales bacterium]